MGRRRSTSRLSNALEPAAVRAILAATDSPLFTSRDVDSTSDERPIDQYHRTPTPPGKVVRAPTGRLSQLSRLHLGNRCMVAVKSFWVATQAPVRPRPDRAGQPGG